MRKMALILAIGLVAALLHFGAMAGFEAIGAFQGSHAAHDAGAMPLMSACPLGYVCPVAPNPLAGLVAAAVLLLVAVVPFLAAQALPALPILAFASAGPPFRSPDDPKTLLSVFKRE